MYVRLTEPQVETTGATMATSPVPIDDNLWERVAPLLPLQPSRPRGGRPRLGDRLALNGILHVLKTGTPWECLPQGLGFGSGMTCWRRLRDWQRAGVWDHLHRVLLDRLRGADQLDWSRAVVDSSSVRAVFGGRKPAPTLRIAGKTARSITSSRMRTAFPWPRR